MTDCFALLGEVRRPWLEPEALKQKFLSLSATLHPDRVHAASAEEKQAAHQRYTELNAAYHCLRDPKERVRHLLELELGVKPDTVQRIPPDLMDSSLEVSHLCREADAFLAEKAAVTSPLLQVRLFERGQEWTEKLLALQKRLQSHTGKVQTELQETDAAWTSSPLPGSSERQALLARLEGLWRLLSYFARWQGQIQERIVQLSL